MDYRYVRNQAGADRKIGFVLPSCASEHLRMAANREIVSGAFTSTRFCGERGELGSRLFDGLCGDVWHRHAGISALVVQRFVARGERNRRLADFLESFPAREGDPFGRVGGPVRQGLAPQPLWRIVPYWKFVSRRVRLRWPRSAAELTASSSAKAYQWA